MDELCSLLLKCKPYYGADGLMTVSSFSFLVLFKFSASSISALAMYIMSTIILCKFT